MYWEQLPYIVSSKHCELSRHWVQLFTSPSTPMTKQSISAHGALLLAFTLCVSGVSTSAWSQDTTSLSSPRGVSPTSARGLQVFRQLSKGLSAADSLSQSLLSGTHDDTLFFRWPVENRDYELAVTLQLDSSIDRIAIYSAERLYAERERPFGLPQRLEYQFNLYADGIYNIRYPKYGVLLGIKGVRVIEPQPPLDQRQLLIRRRGDDVQFWVNGLLVANMVTSYRTINEIGIDFIGTGVEIRDFRFAYLVPPDAVGE